MRYQLEDHVAAVVDRRVQRGHDPNAHDVFDYLLHSKIEQLERTEMIQNAITLVLAGSETTGSAMTGAIWLLCSHPEIMDKVKQEVGPWSVQKRCRDYEVGCG